MTRTIFGDPDNLWDKYSVAGERAFKKAQYKEAETYWLNALRIAQDLSRSQYKIHVSLIRLSMLYRVMGKETESGELLRWSRRLWDLYEHGLSNVPCTSYSARMQNEISASSA